MQTGSRESDWVVLMAMSRRKNNDMRWCTLLVVAMMLCSTIVGLAAPVDLAYGTDAQKKIDEAAEAGRKATEAQKQVNALRAEIKDLDAQADEYYRQAQALQPKIDDASGKTEQLTRDLRELEEEAEKLRSKIAATSAEYSKQQELVGGRMSETYKQGDFFFFDLLLSSQSFKDLLTRFEYVQRAIESNALYARDLDLTRRELEDTKSKLDHVVADAATKQKEAADAESSLRTLKASREDAAHNAELIQTQKSALMEDTQANADKLRALEAELYAEANKILGNLNNSVTWGSGEYAGTFVFPVQGSYNMSCSFGCGCSIHGGNHAGQDFGTYSGTPPIVSVAPGRVVIAGWNGGYGNFVAVDHGNGVVTQYAHLSTISVSVGTIVGAGQQIGNAGSTGFSFGNHLHFEVVVNGSYRNPMAYF
jgi:murein DD-endopeptidase MepM/ murein hydrolase activator NlpD